MEFVPAKSGEQFMYKNRLQEYAQKSAIPLPVYQTLNEGSPHAPKFRSTVMIDGAKFISSSTYNHRKSAEQDVASVALESLSRKIKQEGMLLIHNDTFFCKSILNEYATKVNLERPNYVTAQSHGLVPVFISTAVFDGNSHTGVAGKNKREAEQLAARAVIEFILSNSSTRSVMSQIIKSKGRLFAAVRGGNCSVAIHDVNLAFGGHGGNDSNSTPVVGNEVQTTIANDNLAGFNNPGVFPSLHHASESVLHSLSPEIKKPKEELACRDNAGQIGNGASLPMLTQCGSLAEGQSHGLQLISDGSDPSQSNQVKVLTSVSTSLLSNNSPDMAASSRKRRRKQNKQGKQSKMTRTGEPVPTDSPVKPLSPPMKTPENSEAS